MAFELRPYQEPIAERVFEYMRKNEDNHPLVGMPTGSGKTVVLADIILKAIQRWPSTKVLVLSHVREILVQDYEAIKDHTKLDVGLYSVGLKKRERKQVTVAGIQSVFRKADMFMDYKLIIIDECHLIPPGKDTMYRKFFSKLNNPRYFGLTATPFRLGSGFIYGQDDSIFSDMIYDMTSKEKFNGLIKDGYLCNLKTSPPNTELDLENIRTVAGDFDKKMLSQKVDKDSITKRAVKELVEKGESYKKWLIFAIDIEHAENIAEELTKYDIPTMVVHSKMEFDRDTVIDHYKRGTFRAIVNVNVLTTGFDDPEIDLIALLRPTKSPVIHVQTIGRGLRIAPGKDHCLILDFAGNTERLGPINDIVPTRKNKGKGGEPITKRCPACDTIHHPTAKVCEFCGHKFQFKTLLRPNAKDVDVIKDRTNIWVNVTDVKYRLHKKTNSPSMVKVTYSCGLREYHEYVCIEHKGYAGYAAKHWLEYRGLSGMKTALGVVHNSDELRKPNRINIDKTGKYPRVKDYSF
jgi:DNA repair protein RadD